MTNMPDEGKGLEVEYLSCPVCGREEAKPLFSETFRGNDFRVVRCKGCRLTYLSPRPSEKEVSKIYVNPSEEEVKEDLLAGLRASPGVEEREGFKSKYLTFYQERVENGATRVLDVACRDGSFLELLKEKYGLGELFGIEFRSNLARISLQRGFKVNLVSSPGSLGEAGLPADFFDIVVMRHILEHLHNPLGALKEVHRILKRGGALRVEVPNVAGLSKMISGKYWNGFYIPWHLYFFSPETLASLLKKAGFEEVRMQTFPYPHYLLSPLRVFQPLFPKRVYRRVGREAGTSRFVGALLFPLNLLAMSLGKGDEIIAIYQKG